MNDQGGPRRVLEPAFARAQQQYVELRSQYEAGSISADAFDAGVRAQTIGHGGRFWMIGVESGEWYASQGDGWEKADPPSAARAPSAAPPPPRTSHDVLAAQPGRVDWALVWAAVLVASVAFLYLTRQFLF